MTGALGVSLHAAPDAGAARPAPGRAGDRRDGRAPRGRALRAGDRRIGSRAMETRSATKWVYDFGEGSRDMRDLLGGKGANVAEMTRILGAERVPAGLHDHDGGVRRLHGAATATSPTGSASRSTRRSTALEEQAGKKLGDADDPLLVSVRSGARESMPGMLDTVLNLGLNDESVEGLAEQTGERALRVGLLPALRADVRQRRARHPGRALRGRDQGGQARPRRQATTPSSTSTR